MTWRESSNPGPGAAAGARRTSLAPGHLLGGKYRIEAVIAEGGMGVVLRATHLELDCPVAIKLIRPEHTENEDVIARLLTEARIAAGLRSKHVNRVLDVGRTDTGLPYLVLEHLEGSDLSGYLERRGRLPIVEAVDCVMQACEALAEAHAFGIVHRDLKPDNLFLSEEADGSFVLKVLDFGISKAPAARRAGRTLTNPFEVVGSPSYMAPEQIRGGQVDARADIWALGVLLHELVSGDPPFAAATINDTFSLILDEGYTLPPLEAGPVSDQLFSIISRCTQRGADERYQDVVELAGALAPLSSDPTQARRVAKVALASRARVIATADTLSLANPGTPLGLSTPTLDVVKHEPRRRTPTKWLVGLAACLVTSAGLIAFLAAQHRALPPSALVEAPPPPRAALPSSDLGGAVVAVASVPPAPSAPSPASAEAAAPAGATAARPPPPQPWRPRTPVATTAPLARPAPAPRLTADPEPTVAPSLVGGVSTAAGRADEPAASRSESRPTPGDAWDPKSFGGRR
jgi:eukaryotic-like serine/threonine-protein kinase